MTGTEVREVLLTSVVTTVVVLVAFVALRLTFPDPPIEGSSCPSSLGEPAYGECIRSWHVSHTDRSVHRIATGLGVILVATAALMLLERRRILPGVRLPFAFAIAAGFTIPQAAIIIGAREPAGAAYLGAVGLFALASLLPDRRTRWQPWLLATVLGAVTYFGAVLVYLMFFYSWP